MEILWLVKLIWALLVASVAVHYKAVVLFLFIHFYCLSHRFGGFVYGPCFLVKLFSVFSSFAIILKRKSEIVAVL